MYYDYDEEQFNAYKEECDKIKYSLGDEINWSNIRDFDVLKIDDIIYVQYSPCSQKYLFLHTPECGVIIRITDSGEIFIKNHKDKIITIEKENLSMYSKGYDYYIQKLETNNSK